VVSKETCINPKETFRRDLQKNAITKTRAHISQHIRDLYTSKETYKRELQKRPTKETYKRDLQKNAITKTRAHMSQHRPVVSKETCIHPKRPLKKFTKEHNNKARIHRS